MGSYQHKSPHRRQSRVDAVTIAEISPYPSMHIVASKLKDPICHSDECQIGSFSSEATICIFPYEYL